MHVPVAPAACDLTRPGAAPVPARRGSPPPAPGLWAKARGRSDPWAAVRGRATPPGSGSSPGERHSPTAGGWPPRMVKKLELGLTREVTIQPSPAPHLDLYSALLA